MKTHRVTIGKKSKELICFSEIVIMLEMLRNWGEPALLALDIYQIIRDANFTNFQKKEAETMHFTFIKEKVFAGNMTSVESTIVSKCFQHFVIVLNYPTSRTEKAIIQAEEIFIWE